MYRTVIKPLIDFVLSFGALIVLLPVFLLIIILFSIANAGTPFFIQPRPGKNNRIFKLVKFKTMNDKRDANGKLLPDRERLTKVGRYIRSASLDELPQLLNVIKGDMSLIGPRPLLVSYLPLYSKEQARRHEVRPGITGWAQVNGRNAISWQQKFELDVWYVKNISFLLDIRIIWLTLKNVVQRKGIDAGSGVTMPPFNGNN
jgi:lipopolysaccharide/colanic/teichoic acid biosynthesis glycosyltransferase